MTPHEDDSRQVMGQLELRRRLAQYSRNQTQGQGKHRVDAIHRALEAQDFLLHYQPVVDVQTGRIVKLEALLRWNDPVRGLLLPAEFLGALEESGLIVKVGEWVLRQAAADYIEWSDHGITPPPVAVNISPLHLSHPAFLADLRGALMKGGAYHPRLEIEIPETALAQNPGAAIGRLHAVQQLGIHVCIDDFSARESLLRHLSRMPVDSLKIDRGLIARLLTAPKDRAVVTGMMALAGSLNLDIVAKGVETDSQRTLLQQLGCQRMQGFLLGRPSSMQATESLLRCAQDSLPVDWQSSSVDLARLP